MRWFSLTMLVACGPPPEALFDVDCADQACETVVLTSRVAEDVDLLWRLDGEEAGGDPSVEHTVPADELHVVQLEVSTAFGSSSHSVALIPNVAMELDADGRAVAGATGYDLLEEKQGGIIATGCGLKEFPFSTIGGCFKGTSDVWMYYANGATMPASPAGYADPAHFSAGGPSVSAGDWNAARARVAGGTPVLDPPGATWAVGIPHQAFQGTFPIGVDPVWLSVVPADSVHRYTASVQCVDDRVIWGKSGKSTDEILDWLRR